MAPLAPSNTARYRFFYTVIGQQHTLQVRSGASPTAVGGFFNFYMTQFASELFATILDFTTWAPSGSDIFNPVVSGYDGTTWGAGAGSQENIPWAYTFIGRTPGGRRVRFNQYGAKTLSANYRTTAGENTAIDDVVALLNDPASLLLGIDGLTPIWKTYADNQVNDHWIKVIRP